MKSNIAKVTVGDQTISLEINRYAPQANASVMATQGKTKVLATVVMGRLDASKGYFPLSVEYVDKLFAGGVIKGGKWVKRELNPADTSILSGRIIDRAIRPLFPEGFSHEVQVVATVLSNDKQSDAVVTAFTAVSVALSISNIPFNGPVAAVRVKDDNLDLLVCTSNAGVNMIEAGANIVANDVVLTAIEQAKNTGDDVNRQISALAKEFGTPKVTFESTLPSADLVKRVEADIKTDIDSLFANGADTNYSATRIAMEEKLKKLYEADLKAEKFTVNHVIQAVDQQIHHRLRSQTLDQKRFDGRKIDEIRPLDIEAGVLPCTHGSASFRRGLTQVLTVTTLSALNDKQFLQDSTGETTKRYIHYYAAPPYSTGEAGRIGRPGRREVGHGALAEKALGPVIPAESEFPYMIVLNSEILSQNGSSSMASTCGSTMSLMDAGVPIKDRVAGISVGLVAETDDKYVLLTDIAGIEDHHGDMDFKITGTRNGITAIQLDIKRAGLTLDMIRQTFTASTTARLFILDQMEKVLAAPRPALSEYAPKITMIKLPEDKIGDVIGSGGKTIRGLMAKYGVQVDVDDNGFASISAIDMANVTACAAEIEAMIKEVEIGEVYDGVVTRVENYGAFVEFLPGREALLHVSELSGGFVDNPASLIKIGDKLSVTILGFNDNHQIKLSAPEFKAAHPGQPRQGGISDSAPRRFANFQPHDGPGGNRASFRPGDRKKY